MTARTCETCRWWNRDETSSTLIAECRRNPPHPADSMIDPRWWAHTHRTDWCGEHTPTPQPTRAALDELIASTADQYGDVEP
jgi:hypothetical protein